MPCDLEAIYGELARTLPTSFDGEDRLVLNEKNLPLPPERSKTDRLVVHKSMIQKWVGYREELVRFTAERSTYGCLGLLAAAFVFQTKLDRIRIELTSPATVIKNLVIECGHLRPDKLVESSGYLTLPHALVYVPEEIDSRFPIGDDISPSELPEFRLANLEGRYETEADWLNRDTVTGFGALNATALLAELFLRMSNPNNSKFPVMLSTYPYPRQVGNFSIEAMFWTPEAWESTRSQIEGGRAVFEARTKGG
jgi:hypothetical protein